MPSNPRTVQETSSDILPYIYFKYPIPNPIPLSLPSGSALLGRPGLGLLIVPLSTQGALSSSSSTSFSFKNPGLGTLKNPFSTQDGFGRPIASLSTAVPSLFLLAVLSRLVFLDALRDAGLSPKTRNPSREARRERRIGISVTATRRRR